MALNGETANNFWLLLDGVIATAVSCLLGLRDMAIIAVSFVIGLAHGILGWNYHPRPRESLFG